MNFAKILMVGPDIDGLGGISRVCKNWKNSSLFEEFNVRYIPTITDKNVNKEIFLIKNIFYFMISLFKDYNVIWIHTSSYNSFIRKSIFVIIGYLFKKKIILHIHPSHFYDFLMQSNSFERKYLFCVLRTIDIFVVITEDMKTKIQYLFPNTQVKLIRNSIDFKKFNITKTIKRNNIELIYLGWYIKNKGVYDLVDAMEMLIRNNSKITLNFYGTKQYKKLKNYVDSKMLSDSIKVNGWINDEKKIEALLRCTAIVLPSYDEGFPNVILEAMATKTPIISSSVGGLKEILIDGFNCIICQPGDSFDLSKKIQKCFENKLLRDKISQNAYNEGLKLYDINIIKNEFRKIFDIEKKI